jgi:hypothetical protein
MADTKQLPQLVFKLLYAGALVGKPTAVQDFSHAVQEAVLVADVRATDVEDLVEAFLAAKDGEIIQIFFCDHVNAVSSIS